MHPRKGVCHLGQLWHVVAHVSCHRAAEQRIGCFSYGSGCCSEFFSGVASKEGQDLVRKQRIDNQLGDRHELTMSEYDEVLRSNTAVRFGTRNAALDTGLLSELRGAVKGGRRLYLKSIREFHREYEWTT